MATKSTPSDLIQLARISGAYGVKGWIKLQTDTIDSSLLKAKNWWLKSSASNDGAGDFFVPIKANQARVHGASIVAKLDSIDDRDAAHDLRGNTVWVSRADFNKLDNDEFYWVDLIDCLLYGINNNNEKALIGKVTSVMDNGAHGVLQVSCLETEGGEFLTNKKGYVIQELVPFVKAYVHTVDIENKILISNWPVDLG